MKHLLGITVALILLRALVLNVLVPHTEVMKARDASAQTIDLEKVEPAPLETLGGLSEVECFAQTIYSEDNLETPRLWMAWLIRERVEQGIRGNTYCSVTRAPRQFSGISVKSDPGYQRNHTIPHVWQDWLLSTEYWKRSAAESYERALLLANAVMHADPALNPVPEATHALAPQALHNGWPNWAYGKVADYVYRNPGTKETRWAFYKHSTIEG